jgi:5-methyltetrahydropteroyltriglutamate--homocysteine methyltransferase
VIRAMYAKEEGVPIEPAALAQRVASAVEEVVRKQADARANVINEGEMSKPSCATYIKDATPRLSLPHYSLGCY